MTDPNGLRIIFAGTPDFAAIHLKALLTESHHRVVAVYSQPDRPAGRGKKLQASPVKRLAQEAGVAVQQPSNLKDSTVQLALDEYQADIMVVVAYGLLLPIAVLSMPRLGCINVHASLLPRWRGAAPIQRAIESGDRETGITIMQMDEGLDTGDMLLRVHCPIAEVDTAQQVHDRLAAIGPQALLETLSQLEHGTAQPVPQQDSLASYAHKLSKEEARLDWQLTARDIQRRIQAFNPFPMAYTSLKSERLRILEAHTVQAHHQVTPGEIIDLDTDSIRVACGDNSVLALTKVQLPGKKALTVRDLLNGSAHLFHKGMLLADQ